MKTIWNVACLLPIWTCVIYGETTAGYSSTFHGQDRYDLLSAEVKKFTGIVRDNERLIARLEQEVQRSNSEVAKLREQVDALEAKVSQQESVLALLKAPFPKSCAEILLNDQSKESGMYWVDPDGHGIGDPAIHVYCNMSTGSTSVFHDREELTNVTRCREAGCYTQPIHYNATMRQMMALIQQSSHCHQLIEYECFSAPLEFNGRQYSWWNDRHGHEHYFWSGSRTGEHRCHCAVHDQCFDPTMKCNCDSIAPLQLSDIGHISNKSLLPITRMNFGRLLTSMSSGNYRLGRLECTGFVAFEGVPSSCEDLKKIGHQFSGIYTVKADNKIQNVYCDMTKLPGDEDLETMVGSSSPTPVYFYVQKSHSFYSQGVIPFEVEVLNVGAAMDLKSGVFTSPVHGVYFFTFDGKSSDDRVAHAFLQVNNKSIATSYEHQYNRRGNFHISSMLKLNAGDEVSVYLQSGSINGDSNSHTHFVGMLVNDHVPS